MPGRNPRKRSRGGRSDPRHSEISEEGKGAPVKAKAVGARPLQFTRLNWMLLGAAAVAIVVGYLALSSNSPVLSTIVGPVVLVGAYAVLIPLGLIL